LENIFALLREFDLKAKGVNADGVEEGELMKELVYKILH
jgi:DNA polymerase III subunit delta